MLAEEVRRANSGHSLFTNNQSPLHRGRGKGSQCYGPTEWYKNTSRWKKLHFYRLKGTQLPEVFLIIIQNVIVLATFTDVRLLWKSTSHWGTLDARVVSSVKSFENVWPVTAKLEKLSGQSLDTSWPWEGGSPDRILTFSGFPSIHCSSGLDHSDPHFVDNDAQTIKETVQTLKLCAGRWGADLDLNRGSSVPIIIVQISHWPLWTYFCEP